jgi:uncharacterized membrane protein YfcA
LILCIYSVVILIATLLGALSGLGGGIIIKPILDVIGYHDLSTISFISTSAVFTMAFYAVIKHVHKGTKIDWCLTIYIALGSLLGGYIGNYLFTICLTHFVERYIQILQTSSLLLLLVWTLIAIDKTIKVPLKQKKYYLLVGLLLGSISSFLGIGGGPFNVTIFTCLFHIPLKRATVYSLVTIVFSQGSKLVTIALTSGFGIYDTSILYYCLPVALLGGVLGLQLHKKLTTIQIQKLFKATVMGIMLLNVIIIIKNIL